MQLVRNSLQLWVDFRIMCTCHGWPYSLPLFWCFYHFVVAVKHYHYFQHRWPTFTEWRSRWWNWAIDFQILMIFDLPIVLRSCTSFTNVGYLECSTHSRMSTLTLTSFLKPIGKLLAIFFVVIRCIILSHSIRLRKRWRPTYYLLTFRPLYPLPLFFPSIPSIYWLSKFLTFFFLFFFFCRDSSS